METTLRPTCVPDGRTVWPVVWGCGLGGIPGVACRGVGVETDCDSNGVARSEDKVGQSAAGPGVPGIRGLVDCVAAGNRRTKKRRDDPIARLRRRRFGGRRLPVLVVLAVGAPISGTLRSGVGWGCRSRLDHLSIDGCQRECCRAGLLPDHLEDQFRVPWQPGAWLPLKTPMEWSGDPCLHVVSGGGRGPGQLAHPP